MLASVKLQMTVLELPLHLQMVKAVIAVLTRFMGCAAGIENSDAPGAVEVLSIAAWVWFHLCLYAFDRDNKNCFTSLILAS